ncbi:MAG: hypothetical protein ACRC30_01880, partial [Clostridium sp.]
MFDLRIENVCIRFLLLGLVLVLNINEKANIFLVVVYLLSIFILTLGQELLENKKGKLILYTIALVVSVLFMNVNFQIGFVGAICLITEVATRIKCGSAIFFSVVFVFVMGRLEFEDNVIYLIITGIDIYFTSVFRKKNILIKKEKEELEYLKEKFY